MNIAVRGRPSYILVEERCRSESITILTSDKGGQRPEVRQVGSRTSGDTPVPAQHFLPFIRP